MTKMIKYLLLSMVLIVMVVGQKVEPGEEIITQVLKMGISPPVDAPDRGDESEGPFKKLVIKNANVIDGSGAPPQGPITIVIKNDRIVNIIGGGTGGLHIEEKTHSKNTKVIDAKGMFVLPGFIDAHGHLGTPTHAFGGKLTNPEYVLKLWLAHGITTVRDPGSIMGLEWTLEHKKRSEAGEIAAPRIVAHALFPEVMKSPKAARVWVNAVRKRGADGLKFLGGSPNVIEAAIKEAKKLGMKTTFHHAQVSVNRINVLTSARWGLNSMEHWYGLPEAMFEDKRVQDYPFNYHYNNEQDRFAQAGRLWAQSTTPGSEKWNSTIQELIDLDFTIDPTFNVYESNRELMREQNAPWHKEYSMPYMTRAFTPNPKIHGSYHFDWTTADEIAWKNNYKIWMQFVNDFKNAGGRVTVGSDSGFIYKVFGFGYIRELEMLQEAGFHPLEVLQAATINGAESLGLGDEIGTIEIGKKADLVIVGENPLANFKILYGTGHRRFNLDTGQFEMAKGIQYTIKDGIIYDARKLLTDVRELVVKEKEIESRMAK